MADDESSEKKSGGKKKLIIMVGVVLLAAGGYMFLGKGGSKDAAAAPPPPEKGAVVKLDPVYLNLADGRYLKLGLALQASKTAGEAVEGAEALDAAIKIFSNRSVKELSDPEKRSKAQEDLVKAVQKSMGKDKVLDVFFTEFVMQ